MSILNFWCYRNRAIVATDTMAETPEGTTLNVSKCIHVPHANVLVAGRGQAALAPAVALHITLMDGTYDTLAPRWTQILEEVWEIGARMGTPYTGGSQIALIGYSSVRQTFEATLAMRASTSEPYSAQVQPGLTCPMEASWMRDCPTPKMLDARSIEALMRYQVQKWRSESQSRAIGGRIVLTEIVQNGATANIVGSLD